MINTSYNNQDIFCFKSDFSEINDCKMISYVKNISEMALNMFATDLLFTNDWNAFLKELNLIDGNQNPKISQNGFTEILKILVERLPYYSCLLKSLDINQETRIEIGKSFAEKDHLLFFINIDDFGIKDEEGLVEIYKTITEKAPKTVIKELPRLKINNEKNVFEILWLAAKERPDLVIKSIHKMKIQNQIEKNRVMLQCITQIPNIALNSKKISAWIDQHQVLVFENPELEKIIKASKVGPSQDMRKIFRLFKKMANPSTSHLELTARCLWREYYKYRNVFENDRGYRKKCEIYEQLTNLKSLTELDASTRCGVTAFAIQYAVFGHKAQRICLKKNDYRKEKLDEVWEIIKNNEGRFDGCSSSHFFGYFFHSSCIDHCFAIIQYRDAQNQVKYKFLQSWINRHSLNDYMEKHKRDLISTEFAKFTEGFNHVLFSEDCTEQKEIFFKNFFMNKSTPSKFPQNSRISIEWNCSNSQAVAQHFHEFEQVKDLINFKNI